MKEIETLYLQYQTKMQEYEELVSHYLVVQG